MYDSTLCCRTLPSSVNINSNSTYSCKLKGKGKFKRAHVCVLWFSVLTEKLLIYLVLKPLLTKGLICVHILLIFIQIKGSQKKRISKFSVKSWLIIRYVHLELLNYKFVYFSIAFLNLSAHHFSRKGIFIFFI